MEEAGITSIRYLCLNFGKYRDERLVDVAAKDKGYIDWLKENYGKEPVRSLLKKL